MRNLLVFVLLAVISTVFTLKCTVCEFKLLPPYNSACNETCEGDVCFIVVNKFFNGTINAGCMHLHEDDSFENAICQRGKHDNRCACTTKDFCNNPNVSISSYTFTEHAVLENYQWLPQIQPPMPTVQPVIPPEDIRDMNETATELENGVEDDLAHELDNTNTTQVLRNEENDDLLTVTTTIGLNVRDHTQNTSGGRGSEEQQNDVETSTPVRGFTPGEGSVEVTRVTQEALDTAPRNLTVSDGSEGPNASGFLGLMLVPILTVLVYNLA